MLEDAKETGTQCIRCWEYVRIQSSVQSIKTLDDAVDELGRQGWELVSAVDAGSSYVHLWFKRPLDR